VKLRIFKQYISPLFAGTRKSVPGSTEADDDVDIIRKNATNPVTQIMLSLAELLLSQLIFPNSSSIIMLANIGAVMLACTFRSEYCDAALYRTTGI